MRILVIMSAYNEVDFLVKNIQTLYPYVDSIAVSMTNHITGELSDDGTVESLIDFNDKDFKIKIRQRGNLDEYFNRNIHYDIMEGAIKTELMNMLEPEDGDWIWVIDADEFYSEFSLERLRSRYLLNHDALNYNKHCLMVSAMVFAYDTHHFYYSRHGRLFRYKKGSYFKSVNHYTLANGEPIYGDKYGWDISPMYMVMYHMRYVRENLDRLRNRYVYRQDKAGRSKLVWFDEVFMKYPSNSELALQKNKYLFGADGFDGMLSGDLKYINDPLMPKILKELNIDLMETIRRRNESSNLRRISKSANI